MRNKRKSYVDGGTLAASANPYLMIAQQGAQMAGDYVSAFNYKPTLGPEKTQGDYAKDIIMKGIQGGGLAAIPSIIRMSKDKNTTVFGSPGTYQQGGPIKTPATGRRKPASYYEVGYYTPVPQPVDVTNLFNPFTTNASTNIPSTNVMSYDNTKEAQLGLTGVGKSKSRDRFREKATGGSLNDQALSNQAFQVKDNPNVTDGKYYGQYNANLDHNEVVDKNAKFVFSDELGAGNKSFAQQVKPIYKKLGDLEVRKDPISVATADMYKKQINDIAMTQEELATALGLRNNNTTNHALGGYTGGPKPKNNLPWEGFDVAQFQAWYNTLPGAEKITLDGKWGPASKSAYDKVAFDYMNAVGKNKVTSIGGMSIPDYENNKFVSVTPNSGIITPSSLGGLETIPQKPIMIDTPDGPVDISELIDGTTTPKQETIADREARVRTPEGNPIGGPIEPQTGVLNPTVAANEDIKNALGQFTLGDALQAIEVGSKFFNTTDGPQVQGQLVDNTPITKVMYDSRNALMQNQRNFQGAINTMGTSSANTRRATANSLLANKLNADNQVLTNYQNMNNEALVNYEGRVSQRRQQNIASQFRTDDINAANLGAYDQAQQNAFTSLGNFGESLNRKRYSADVLTLLKQRYPDIYDSVMKDINGIKTSTTTTIKTTG